MTAIGRELLVAQKIGWTSVLDPVQSLANGRFAAASAS